MTTPELKPCGCGSIAMHRHAIYVNNNHRHWVICQSDSCGIRTPEVDNKEDALRIWNTRPIPQITDEMVERFDKVYMDLAYNRDGRKTCIKAALTAALQGGES